MPNTRKFREVLIETTLDDLIPILKDYSEMIDKNSNAKRKKDERLKL